ncbi:hypothetical protein BD408DRAFT_423325 [Parasitella parasitica]|nr:hypothetical protein BD408DRAFT_423325 [Parasitella parasitica]
MTLLVILQKRIPLPLPLPLPLRLLPKDCHFEVMLLLVFRHCDVPLAVMMLVPVTMVVVVLVYLFYQRWILGHPPFLHLLWTSFQ